MVKICIGLIPGLVTCLISNGKDRYRSYTDPMINELFGIVFHTGVMIASR